MCDIETSHKVIKKVWQGITTVNSLQIFIPFKWEFVRNSHVQWERFYYPSLYDLSLIQFNPDLQL